MLRGVLGTTVLVTTVLLLIGGIGGVTVFLLSVGVDGVATEVTTTDDAIFLNFLWVYNPSDSSHLCSTGSTAAILLFG